MASYQSEKRPCRHFARGFCFYGVSCKQSHDPDVAATSGSAAKIARQQQYLMADIAVQACKARLDDLKARDVPLEEVLAVVGELSDLKAAKRRASSRPAKQKTERAGIFRRFLIDTYGIEALSSGCGVLDVAGGHGSLSFELVNIDGVPSTIVDPRPVERGFARLERKWRVLAKQPWDDGSRDGMTAAAAEARQAEEAEDLGISASAAAKARARVLASRRVHLDWKAASERQPRCRRPQHWRLLWAPELYEHRDFRTPPTAAELQAFSVRIDGLVEYARGMEWTSKGLLSGGADDALLQEAQADVDECLDECLEELEIYDRKPERPDGARDTATAPSLSASEAWEALASCSIVAGMHPDGATEGIVDFALRHRKPFAVVPCCICPPTRPMTFAAFIKHLVAKAPERIRTCTLPFEGKNVCVYSVPEVDSGAPGAVSYPPLCVVCEDGT